MYAPCSRDGGPAATGASSFTSRNPTCDEPVSVGVPRLALGRKLSQYDSWQRNDPPLITRRGGPGPASVSVVRGFSHSPAPARTACSSSR
jgi:hypothetical protein